MKASVQGFDFHRDMLSTSESLNFQLGSSDFTGEFPLDAQARMSISRT